MRLLSRLVGWLALALIAAARRPRARLNSNDFHVARQPGLVYIQAIIMEEKKLIEKHAAALGMKDVKMQWSIITSGGVMTEAIISNSIDMAITGVSNMLLAWGKTGNIKMLTGVAGVPFKLLTRNAKVKSIKDFGPDDRIAVPTIRASMQAMMMGIALEQAYGIGQHGRLDSNQVQLGHPDAMQALLNPQHEVNSHFSIPPFQDIAREVAAGASRADLDRRARRARPRSPMRGRRSASSRPIRSRSRRSSPRSTRRATW